MRFASYVTGIVRCWNDEWVKAFFTGAKLVATLPNGETVPVREAKGGIVSVH